MFPNDTKKLLRKDYLIEIIFKGYFMKPFIFIEISYA
jgi:hypothetical protein